ncbi:MAG: BrnT family toxin [Bacilli bacterium]|nr:BrnT family toxin [Bacilli bacterium]
MSFEEAKTVFYDDAALVISDPDNSVTEDRFVILGFSANARILVV